MLTHPHICLPNGIIKNIQDKNKDLGLKRKFHKALLGLQVRPYPHGVYVKKLKSPGSFLLEARIDGSQRLLFNYTSRYCERCQECVPYIRILDYIEDHDDVNRAARRLNLEIDDSTLKDWESAPPKEIKQKGAGAGFEAYASKINCSEETIENSAQWFVFDEQEFEQFISSKNKELRLLLTKDQASYLREPGPVIINGSAGSGKTTLGIYYLIKAISSDSELQALYVTYSSALLRYSQNLFLSLCASDLISEKFGQPGVFFTTYRDLCIDIAPEHEFDGQCEETFPRFKQWLQRFPNYRRLDPAKVWTEIRSVLRGSATFGGKISDGYLASDMISEQEYLDLGEKGTVFSDRNKESRSSIYDIGKRYVLHLKEENRYDELSLTRAALRNLEDQRCDFMVVDEVQDLTELQVELLLRLLPEKSEGKNLFITGDLQQVINPSSFRWENVRSLFYGRGWAKPNLLRLNHNFRCRGPIINLANRLLEIRQNKIGQYSDETMPEIPTDLEGELPIICWEDEDRFINKLKQIDVQGLDIIVRTESTQARLKSVLDSESVWTIEETKGLEFKDVLLWELTDSEEGAKFIEIENNELYEGPLSEAAHEFNRIYVAVTRTRRTLAIFEKTGNKYPWKDAPLDDCLQEIPLEAINTHLNLLKTPRDWFERAEYFFKKERYEQAAQAYERAGDMINAKRSKALHAIGTGQHAEAALLFEQSGYFREAAENWEKVRRFSNAAICWEKVKNFVQAATLWEKVKNYSKAAENWSLAGEHSKAASCWEKVEQYENAAVNWEHGGEFRKASECWLKINNYQKAAELLEKAFDFLGAAPLWEKAGDLEKAAKLWMTAGKHNQAALCWEAANQPLMAAICWKNAKNIQKAAQCFEKGKAYSEAAELWERKKVYNRAARNWVLAKEFERGAECWIKGKRYERAAVCMQIIENWSTAGEYWILANRFRNAVACFDKAGDQVRAKECDAKADEIEEARRRRKSELRESKLRESALMAEQMSWDKAGQMAEQLKEFGTAKICYGKARNIPALRRVERKIAQGKNGKAKNGKAKNGKAKNGKAKNGKAKNGPKKRR